MTTPANYTQTKTISPVDLMFNPEVQQSALKFCQSAIQTGLLPKHIDTPAKALVILAKGAEIGMGPMESLSNINVIQGKPELSAIAMSSQLLKGGVSIETVKINDDGCALKLTRTVNGATYSITAMFSRADAERAQLWGKGNWSKYPQDMLYARALSRGARRIGADLIGSAYVQGEVPREESNNVRDLAEPETPRAFTPPKSEALAAKLGATPDHDQQTELMGDPELEPVEYD